MPNWCNNTVVFEGKPEAIEQVTQLFKSMAERERKENCGQLPDFIDDSNGGYFFEVYESDTGIFNYQTKWSPNAEAVKQIAEHYNIDFQLNYEELGCLVYGRTMFSDKLLIDIYLEDEDFDSYELDKETDTYHFEGKEYDSEWEILDTLLERKIENQLNTIKI
ncbi:DUF1281 family ferredoxin-like fold protein [Elizabethkingia anophelis]|uniref:YubB ferredoxin-like domain-containing protein n=1 Tax=Elizabethkingia anophelis TaxID=1117645 RepID=A0A455ZDQ7_9FLAO|nr:hypothetical protein [Elizabethkingia anophelis]DAC74784.1 TPA_exp: hypothetical protein [Elizabethkingia anophelis]